MEHGEIFQRDIPAVFEADSFVAYSRQTAFFTGQSLAIDQSRTADGDIFQTDSPDERVLPVTVSEVLIFIMLVGLCQVISFLLARESGDDACALFQIEMDVAFQPDGITGIFSGRKIYGASAVLCRGFDGTVDGGRVNSLSVRFCSEVSDVVGCCLQIQATGQQSE